MIMTMNRAIGRGEEQTPTLSNWPNDLFQRIRAMKRLGVFGFLRAARLFKHRVVQLPGGQGTFNY
jgi:hypothetical protein